MDSTTTDVTQALRSFASQRVTQEEVEFVAELLLAVREENDALSASALAPLLVESFDGVDWVDSTHVREICDALACVLTGETNDSSGDEDSENVVREKVLAALQREYAVGKSCLAVLTEDDDWHMARIRRHVDDVGTTSNDGDGRVELRLEVEFIEFGKLQIVSLEDVVLDEDVADDEVNGDQRPRCCEMCTREMRLTFHHLTPRVTHAKYLKKGYTKEFLNLGIMICRPCHSKIHSSEDNKTLARDFNTLEKILDHPEIVQFIKYVSKQRTTSRPEKQSRWPIGK